MKRSIDVGIKLNWLAQKWLHRSSCDVVGNSNNSCGNVARPYGHGASLLALTTRNCGRPGATKFYVVRLVDRGRGGGHTNFNSLNSTSMDDNPILSSHVQ